ncbi:MAG: hypothetical protein E7652_03275 [Ruminococcaceae bacterium]|nr:hypothetical protein [Oscillospiraceae bacterium]
MKIKEILGKISDVLRVIFGYGIAIALFAGGLTFFGYIAAFIIGGETATAICLFISGKIIPVIIYISTVMVALGIISMYLKGEVALTSNKKKSAKHQGEM